MDSSGVEFGNRRASTGQDMQVTTWCSTPRCELTRSPGSRRPATNCKYSGKWVHIWRIVGQYSNLSVFDVIALAPDDGEV
ncbi:MAG: muconolactone Delta-isomerase family protein [Pseudonocardiaceae bacterium]